MRKLNEIERPVVISFLSSDSLYFLIKFKAFLVLFTCVFVDFFIYLSIFIKHKRYFYIISSISR